MVRTPLCLLAEKHETDKKPQGHNYTPTYYFLFSELMPSKVLEIGVASGASLRMWRDFFQGAQIWGADIDYQALMRDERIQCILCDQSKPLDLEFLISKIGNEIDIIIEDAAHNHDYQVYTAECLAPHLKVGGYYIIEDVSANDRLDVYTPLAQRLFPKFSVSMVETTNEPNGDSRLIIIKKCAN